ncbi:PIN domain-containing protein [Virgibacillus senegalensis]|uniref:PIN domain-containing protein n=1 Tax=Virgibacillus senegalensis TaxID=1499679 RepID=UPI00069E07F0|nr:PIN domain-containing protein [Virgibacillus senegalensis]
METLISFSFLIPATIMLFVMLFYLALGEELAKKETGESLGYIDYLFVGLAVPEAAFARLYNVKNTEASEIQKAQHGVIVLFIASLLVCYKHAAAGFAFLPLLTDLLLTFGAFFLVIRLWAVVRIHKIYKERKIFESLLSKVEEKQKEAAETARQQRQLERLNEKLREKKSQIEARNNRINVYVANKQQMIKQHMDRDKAKIDLMRRNIGRLNNYVGGDTVVAIDTNILMEGDDYLIEELKKHRILISKDVQMEWDGINKYANGEKKRKGIRARRRLKELVKNGKQTGNLVQFTVKKWDSDFMKENNLLETNDDDRIIADYLYEYKQGRNLVVLSGDHMFEISASIHLPTIELEDYQLFSREKRNEKVALAK